jgi:protein-tyrosine phosphatase
VRLVCDLRRPDERESQPNPDFGPDVRSLSWDDKQESALLQALPEPQAVDRSLARQVMVRHYASMPTRLASQVRGMFRGLAQGPGTPMILHCTAGKDRTGFAAAMLLSALGVPRDAIVDDYLLTNSAVDLRARLVNDVTGFGVAPSTRFIMELRPESQDAVLAADADYLLAAFDAIESTQGSVAAYLRDVIGCDDAMRGKIEQSTLT